MLRALAVLSSLLFASMVACSSDDDSSSSCSDSEASCDGGQQLQICVTMNGYTCSAKSYRVGARTFRCASCDDCIGALNEAMKVCRR